MKKLVSFLTIISMLFALTTTDIAAVSADDDKWDGTTVSEQLSGSGTEADPYIISNGEDLAYLSKETNKINASETKVFDGVYFKVTADIDLGGMEWTPIGGAYGCKPSASEIGDNDAYDIFAGNMDGGGHVISNFKIGSLFMNIGLFGKTSGKIKNLGVQGADISYYNLPAEFTLTNVNGDEIKTKYRSNSVGGFVGCTVGGSFENCFVKDSIIENTNNGCSEQAMGGFVGKSKKVTIYQNCYTYNNSLKGSVNSAHAGFVTNVGDGGSSFTNCYSAKNVFGDNIKNKSFAFGYRNNRSASVTNCYSPETDGTDITEKEKAWSLGVTAASKALILSKFVNNGYCQSADINGGYPSLEFEQSGTTVNPIEGMRFSDISSTQKINFVTENLTLPTTYNGRAITWESLNKDVISDSGVIYDNLDDCEAILAATDTESGLSKFFNITVTGAVTRAFVNGLGGQNQHKITKDIALPKVLTVNGLSYNTEWVTSNSAVISEDGKVGIANIDSPVSLCANVNNKRYIYNLIVPAAGKSDAYSFSENFENMEVGTDITQVQGWNNPATAKGVRYTVETDPTDSENKVLKAYRYVVQKDNQWVNIETGEEYAAGGPASDDSALVNIGEWSSGKLQITAKAMFTAADLQAANQQITVYAKGIDNSQYSFNNSQFGIRRNNATHVATAGGWTSIPKGEPYKWYNIIIKLDFDNKKAEFNIEYDGMVRRNSGVIPSDAKVTAIGFLSNRGADSSSGWYIDDFEIRDIEMSDEQKVSYDKSRISVKSVADDYFTLPTVGEEGSDISWSSDNTSVIDNNGKVTFSAKDSEVTLTATITKNNAKDTKQFKVTVQKRNGFAVSSVLTEKGEEKSYDGLIAGGKITSANVRCNYGGEGENYLYVAVYNQEETLSGISVQKLAKMTENESASISLEKPIQLPDNISGVEIRAFIWNSEQKPLSDVYKPNTSSMNWWILGDSTVCHYDAPSYPQQGWGEYMPKLLNGKVTVYNKAVGGNTVNSYYDTARVNNLAGFIDSVKPGDYASIALGINDVKYISDIEFKVGLKRLIDEFKAKGATPILISPICCQYNDNALEKSFVNPIKIISEVADEENVVFIDLNSAMFNEFVKSGKSVEEIRNLYFMCNINETTWPGLPTAHPNNDKTHINERGAEFAAELTAKLLQNSASQLGRYFK